MRPGFLDGTDYWFGELPGRHYTQSQTYQDQVELKYLAPDDHGLTSSEYSYVKPTVHRDSRGDRPIWTRLLKVGKRLLSFKM
jgi:hypothetical protein